MCLWCRSSRFSRTSHLPAGLFTTQSKDGCHTKFSPSKQLQQFLGMINFYRKFLPNGAALLKPLYEAVKGTHKKTQLNWTSDMQTAFNATKCSLSASATLAHPLPNSTIALTTDASDIGIGACLEQHTERGWQPISFFSKKLKKSEQKYSTFDRELLALYEAVRHFRYFLEGRNFIMFTDHQPLVKSLHKQSDPWSTRQQRHLSYISEHSTDIRHIAGKHNIIADYLSRSPISDTCNQVSMGLDLQALAAAQSTCQATQSYRTAITGMTVADVPIHEGGPSLLCDTSSSNPDPSCHQVTVVTCLTCFTDCHIPALAHLKNLYAVVTCGME